MSNRGGYALQGSRTDILKALNETGEAEPALRAAGDFCGDRLVLSAVGIYSVMAYSVAQRTKEIGVRMAIGAAPGAVMAMVLRRGAALAGAGPAIGISRRQD